MNNILFKQSLDRCLVKFLLAFSASVFSLVSFAEVTLEHTAEVEVITKNEKGEEIKEYHSAEKLLPGDTVVYTTIATNAGDLPAEKIVVTDEISEHVTYVMGSASSSAMGDATAITFSADGGESFATSDKLLVMKEGKKQIATAEDYTHIRWTLNFDLPAGKNATVVFKAQVK